VTTSLEQLQQIMDDYGNVRYLLEDLKSSKETALQKILEKHPEVAQEIQDMEEEFNPKIETAEKAEKTKKKLLEAYAKDYAQTIILKDKGEIKSKLIRIGLDRKIEYDVDALEGMALENPKLLGLRSEKISTRITLNSK
jgi:hypothetical protein